MNAYSHCTTLVCPCVWPMTALTRCVMQERNELRAGSIVTHNQHPCAAPLRLIAREGLSWDKARTKLTAQKRSRWNARPGQQIIMFRLIVMHSPDLP